MLWIVSNFRWEFVMVGISWVRNKIMHAILLLIFSAAQFWTLSDVWRWATENFTTFGDGKRATEIAEKFKKWATENFAILGHRKRAAEIKERAAEIFSVLKSVPAKACSKKCTAGSKVARPPARPSRKKNLESSINQLYDVLDHTNHIFSESSWHPLSTDPPPTHPSPTQTHHTHKTHPQST